MAINEPDMKDIKEIMEMVKNEQEATVWLKFACAFATSIHNGASTTWVTDKSNKMTKVYMEKFGKTNE